jgi:hypothetical protein
MESKRGRDPSTKGLRSGFRQQVLSTKASNPSFGFGSSVRDSVQRVSFKCRQQLAAARLAPVVQEKDIGICLSAVVVSACSVAVPA